MKYIPNNDDDALDRLEGLSFYYKQPVLPIDKYCSAFKTWMMAIFVTAKDDPLRWEAIANILPQLELAISKSNFLDRLLYNGEELRTRKCPVHKGHWSGLPESPPCGCDLTGWLPHDHPGIYESHTPTTDILCPMCTTCGVDLASHI